MPSELTQSGTPDGEPAVVAVDAGENGVSVPVAEAVPSAAPSSLFRPTMRDVGTSASETGTTVAPRPLMPVVPVEGEGEGEGEAATRGEPDAAADQALILGPSDPQGTGKPSPVAEVDGGTPAFAPAEVLADGTNLFGDRAAMWSGDPSEVGSGYGSDPAHREVCLCDEVTLAAGEGV